MSLVQGRSRWVRAIVLAQSIVLAQGIVLAQKKKTPKKNTGPRKPEPVRGPEPVTLRKIVLHKKNQYIIAVTWNVTSRGPSYWLSFCKVLFFFFFRAEPVTTFGPVTDIELVTWKWESLFSEATRNFRVYLGILFINLAMVDLK